MIGNRPLGVDGARKRQFMKRVRIGKGLFLQFHRRQTGRQRGIIAEGGTGQREFLRQAFNAIRSLLSARFLETAVSMQRNGAADGGVRAIARGLSSNGAENWEKVSSLLDRLLILLKKKVPMDEGDVAFA